MTAPDSAYDVHDISDLVTPVIAASPLLDGAALPGFTNGKSFFFIEQQVRQIAELIPAGQLRPRAGRGWEEAIPGKGIHNLAERRINGTTHYRFRKHWQFIVTAS